MGKWEMVRLGDVITVSSGGTPRKDITEYYENGKIPWVKTGDLKSMHIYGTEDKITKLGLDNSSAKIFPKDTLLIAMYGATIGACSILNIDASTNQACAALLPNEKYLSRFLYYYFARIKNQLISMGVGGAQPNISGTIIKQLQIPLPPLATQQKIADILDCANTLIEKRKVQIEKLDLLVKSQFVEMFGDPVTNPMGWDLVKLGDCGSLKNGMNFNQNDSGYSIYSLGVGNFGNLYEIKGTSGISKINLTTKPANDYLLSDGDIVFVRSNGSKELVGRCVQVYTQGEELTFSGFCIRFRNENPKLQNLYLNHVLHLPSMRSALVNDGRGANIQNVNQQMLSSLLIPLPPLDLQTQFATFVEQVESQKTQLKKSLALLELNYKSLMQKCFSGEVF